MRILLRPHTIQSLHRRPLAMPTVHAIVHPRGLHPTEAAHAWQLHVVEGMAIRDVCEEVQLQIVWIVFCIEFEPFDVREMDLRCV